MSKENVEKLFTDLTTQILGLYGINSKDISLIEVIEYLIEQLELMVDNKLTNRFQTAIVKAQAKYFNTLTAYGFNKEEALQILCASMSAIKTKK